ncbi:alpha/beta hydrolase [Corynebacterium sp. L4756]|uniref:alpha/beta hydrolase n=1 Tax=unclassified Corynebacterium TaxID=2624378 RepID=UPI00374C9FFC
MNKWQPDILGEPYQSLTLDLGENQATLVRYVPEDITERPALLWVHGMTDYFFQTHVAEYFHEKGYAFYAIDLRKCGRSRREGELWHYVTDLTDYFEDLDAAYEVIIGRHPSMVPIAHSTAGMIVPMWLGERDLEVPALVLDSPWLDLMGFTQTQINLIRPIINIVGKIFPVFPFPGGGLTAFGESIHKDYHGEWNYDLQLKPLGGHRKYLGWLRTVLNNQHRIHTDQVDVKAPTLVLTSHRSHLGHPYSAETDTADAVIDAEQTRRWAPHLGKDVDIHTILGARHDVFLSLPPARAEAFAITEEFLRKF